MQTKIDINSKKNSPVMVVVLINFYTLNYNSQLCRCEIDKISTRNNSKNIYLVNLSH